MKANVATCWTMIACLTLTQAIVTADEPTTGADGILPETSSGRVTLDELNGGPEGEPAGSPVFNLNAVNPVVGYSIHEPYGPLMRVERRSGDGAAYDSNYTNLNVFVPIHKDPGQSLWFWNLHGAFSDEDEFIGNFGVGFRQYSENLDRIHGASLWFDWDNRTDTFYRLGLSLESLGKWLDYRLNASAAVFGDSNDFANFQVGTPFFQQNAIVVRNRTVTEHVYNTLDGEVGGPLPFLGRYGVAGYIGAYAMWSDIDDTYGAKARLNIQITPDVFLGMQISEDEKNGSTAYMNVSFSFPTGIPKEIFRSKRVQDRMADQVVREYRIPTIVGRSDTIDPLLRAADGQEFFVIHIDPDAPAGGDGTFENPFGSAQEFQNNRIADIIFVRRRDDGTGTNLARSTPFTLFDNQRLLSETVAHNLPTVNNGIFVLGPFDTGSNPILSNSSGGNVIQLANNNEVAGFTIDGGGTGNGVVGTNTNAVNLNRNIFQNGINGVLLTNLSGRTIIDQNNFNNNANAGFNLINNRGTFTMQVTNNTTNGNGSGFLFQAQGSSTLNLSAIGNNFSNNTNALGGGFVASAESQNATINITNFSNNQIDNNAGNGAFFRGGLAGGTGGTINVNNINGNSFDGNAINGLTAQTNGVNGVANLQIGNAGQPQNVFTNNTNGVNLNTNFGTMNVTIQNNLFGGPGNGNITGLNILNDDGTFTGLVGGPNASQQNTFNNNQVGLLAVFNSPNGGGLTPQFTVQNNLFNNNTARGATIASQDNVAGTVTVLQNQFNGNGSIALPGGGLLVQGAGMSTTTFNVSGNQANNNTGAVGIEVASTGMTSATFNVFNNQANNNDVGFQVTIENQSTPTVNLGVNGQNVANNNTTAGVQILHGTTANRESNASNPTVFVSNNSLNGNGTGIDYLGQGSILGGGPTALGQFTFFNNDVTNSQGVGVSIISQGRFGTQDQFNGPGTANDIPGNPNNYQITVSTNRILNSGGDNIFAQFDAQRHQQRFVTLGNPGADITPRQPDEPGFVGGGFFGGPGISFYRENFLNTSAENIARLNIINNIINGAGDHGTEIQVATNTRLHAAVQGNDFSNSATDDFATSSIDGPAETNTSINQGAGLQDTVFLDDTAQLNLLFTDNTGASINAQASDLAGNGIGVGNFGAVYNNGDGLKNFDGAGPFDDGNRAAFLFQVQLNGNTFVDPVNGVIDLPTEFANGNYFVVPFGTPFPDLNFPGSLLDPVGNTYNIPGLP